MQIPSTSSPLGGEAHFAGSNATERNMAGQTSVLLGHLFFHVLAVVLLTQSAFALPFHEKNSTRTTAQTLTNETNRKTL